MSRANPLFVTKTNATSTTGIIQIADECSCFSDTESKTDIDSYSWFSGWSSYSIWNVESLLSDTTASLSLNSVYPNTSTSLDYTSYALNSGSNDTITLLNYNPCFSDTSLVTFINFRDCEVESYISDSTGNSKKKHISNTDCRITINQPWSVPTELEVGTTDYPSSCSYVSACSKYSTFPVRYSSMFKHRKGVLTPFDYMMYSERQECIWDFVMFKNKQTNYFVPIVKNTL